MVSFQLISILGKDASRSALAVASFSPWTAENSAVRPKWSVTLGSAALESRSLMILSLPYSAAKCKAVFPLPSVFITSAPCSSRIRAIDSLPSQMAWWNAVRDGAGLGKGSWRISQLGSSYGYSGTWILKSTNSSSCGGEIWLKDAALATAASRAWSRCFWLRPVTAVKRVSSGCVYWNKPYSTYDMPSGRCGSGAFYALFSQVHCDCNCHLKWSLPS